MNNVGIETLLKQAISHAQTEDYVKAENILTQVLQLNRDCLDAWLLLAKLNLQVGNKIETVDAYKETLRLKPGLEEAVVYLINYHGAKEENEKCEKILRDAITSNPNFARYHFMLGKLLLEKGFHAQATKYQKQAMKLAPNMPQTRVALAEAYSRHGNLDAALETLRPLLETVPPHFQSVIDFANICSPLNMDEDCQTLINKIPHTQLSAAQAEQLRKASKMLLQI